jgi:hypothetical protein
MPDAVTYGTKLSGSNKEDFLKDLKTQVIRFLRAERVRLKTERAFLESVQAGLTEADMKYKKLTEVATYVDVAKLLGLSPSKDAGSSE